MEERILVVSAKELERFAGSTLDRSRPFFLWDCFDRFRRAHPVAERDDLVMIWRADYEALRKKAELE